MKAIYIVSIYDAEKRMQSYTISVPASSDMDGWNKAIAEAQRLAGVPSTAAPQTCQLSHAAVHSEVA
jgi:hypothetical protein